MDTKRTIELPMFTSNTLDLDEYMQRKLILLVDDDSVLLWLMESILEPWGYRVILAEDGSEGWWKYQQHHPSAIVSGISMPPGMDGYEFLKLVKENNLNQVFIVLSAQMNRSHNREKALQLNADAVFGKPFEIDELAAKIEQCLTKKLTSLK
jgi:CheY-like chemotaxis protein